MASAKTIKGITIEIEGKTSGLVKALEEANKELSRTKSALKDVNDALKCGFVLTIVGLDDRLAQVEVDVECSALLAEYACAVVGLVL